ncbi:hypothetical protein GWN63_03995 [Candidatus Bathyarchaeota archaeon]|nr:hypothetical protein [Candidatus Bathyarchaeota archaeon]NIU81392.1 hypothetical protein [Candidatus Bathyarchaeota archaeon]NIV68018.1 hypothetical protein [Candidatus Bathyarchaeota archaeon]NIW34555.1 hypothetical protein [Candidatus Bathyarchaeota archaeon]
MKPWLEQKIITSLALRYTKQVNISIADDGMEEFLRVFNHSSLEKLSGPSENKATEFIYHFGYLDDTLENMRDFLKFKPSTGFGNLVDNFTELYVPGQGNRGLYALYTVSKLRIGINGGFR